MIRQALRVPYWYSKDRLSEEVCNEIIQLGKQLDVKEAGIFGADTSGKLKDNKMRVSNAGWFPKGFSCPIFSLSKRAFFSEDRRKKILLGWKVGNTRLL